MSSASHPIRILGAALLCGVMLPVAILGVVGALSETGPMRGVFGMMALAGLAGGGSGAWTVLDAVRAGRAERRRLLGARSPMARDDALARWSIDRGAARRFADREWASRKVEVVIGAVFLLFAGAGLIWLTKDAEPWAAFATGGLLGTLYLAIGLGKYGAEHTNAMRGHDEVILFEDAVWMLGSWHALAGDRALVGVALAEDALELTVRWQTRGGPAEDTIRVPVPAEARERAADAARVLEERVVG